ncbi:MAG: enoyl-CoA hydratase/isomerase family protein [Longimicrobiales bacterium]
MESIRIETRDGMAIMQMLHGKANTLDLEFCQQLMDALTALAGSTRALVLTGTGSIFSAGVDLMRIQADGPPYIQRFVPMITKLVRALFEFPSPLVAAVNGHAVAGGCVMACAADYRLMARSQVRIGVPELRVGVPFPTAALEMIRFVVPPHKLHTVVYGGAKYLPEEALEFGLVDEVTDADVLLERAWAVARQLADLPRAAFALTKQQLRTPVLQRIAAGAAHDAEVERMWQQPETLQRVRSYVEQTFKPRTV